MATDTRPMTAREKVGLASICAAAMLLPFSVTGPGVALGDIARDVGAGPSAAQWILNTYNICFAALMFGAGVASSRTGRRRGLIYGQLGFVAGSVVCAVAPTVQTLLIGRGIQGVAAALILTSASQYIAIAISGPRQLAAFSLLGSSFGAGLAIGPVVCGGLTEYAGWRAVFVLCAVVAAVAAAGATRLAADPPTSAIQGDPAGIVTFTVALASVCGYFMVAAESGFASVGSFSLLILFGLSVAAFVAIEMRVKYPVVELSLLRSKTFLCVILQPFTILTTFAALLVYVPAYLQAHDNLSVLQSGLALLPLTVPVFVLPLLIAKHAHRLGRRFILGLSPLLMGTGLILSAIAVNIGTVWFEVALLVTGSGIGIAFGVMDSAAANVVPLKKVEIATGMFNSARLISETVGIAIVGSILLACLRAIYGDETASILSTGESPNSSVSLDGLVTTWTWILSGLGVLGVVSSLVLYRGIDDAAFDHSEATADSAEVRP